MANYIRAKTQFRVNSPLLASFLTATSSWGSRVYLAATFRFDNSLEKLTEFTWSDSICGYSLLWGKNTAWNQPKGEMPGAEFKKGSKHGASNLLNSWPYGHVTFPALICNNTYWELVTKKALETLVSRVFTGAQSHTTLVTDFYSPAPPRGQVKTVILQSILEAELIPCGPKPLSWNTLLDCWPKRPGKQCHSYQEGYSNCLKTIMRTKAKSIFVWS